MGAELVGRASLEEQDLVFAGHDGVGGEVDAVRVAALPELCEPRVRVPEEGGLCPAHQFSGEPGHLVQVGLDQGQGPLVVVVGDSCYLSITG